MTELFSFLIFDLLSGSDESYLRDLFELCSELCLRGGAEHSMVYYDFWPASSDCLGLDSAAAGAWGCGSSKVSYTGSMVERPS